ncbi:hypothetical protein [Pseudomonas batumici]|uniref:hypothetical protein n=1 Tax=Pseudomonas batumici TaxID=226910 RepID=UPI00058A518D|nr:hypothetical protein [Pseudomonas batumici]
MGLLKFCFMMALMSAFAALGSATLILTKTDKIAYQEWKLNPKRPTLADLDSEKFPLRYMMGYVFRLLFLVGVICVVIAICFK